MGPDGEPPLARARERLRRLEQEARGRPYRPRRLPGASLAPRRARGQAADPSPAPRPTPPAPRPVPDPWALPTRALPLEGLGARLAAAIRTGHRFDLALGYDPARCGCPACLDCDALLAQLRQPATREAAEWLLARAYAYQARLLRVFEAAAFTSGDAARAAAEADVRALLDLADELGAPLAELVYRMALQAFALRYGACPYCAASAHAAPEEGEA